MTASIKQIAVSLRMRKYPKLSLVGQRQAGMSAAVIDYFKAVFQWSMPQPPGHVDWSSRDLFTAVTISAVCVEFGRRGKAGDGRGTTNTWQKMCLENEVVAQQSMAIGVVSSSAHQAVALKIQYMLQSVLLGELGEENADGKGAHSRTGEKGERRTDRLGRKERCDKGKEQGNKKLTLFQGGKSGNMEGKLKICFGSGENKGRRATRDGPRNVKHNEEY